MKKIKLLYYDFNMPDLIKGKDHSGGGATVEWYAWIKGFVANGHRVGVLTSKGAKNYVGKALDCDIVETYDLNEGIPKMRWIHKRYPALLSAVQEYKPDFLVQECAGYYTGIMAHIGKRVNIPFIYRVANDMDTDKRLEDRLPKFEQLIYAYGIKHAEAIICQNAYQYDQMKKQYPQKKLAIVHNPYYYDGEFPDIKLQNEKKYVAWIGIFQYQKNLPLLFEIVKSLPGIEFRIAGKLMNKRPLDENTGEALRLLEESKNVKFVGYLTRTEVIPFLSKAYALLNTSQYEGFSNTFLESFFAGTPIVTTSRVDPDNIIDNHGLGRAVKSDGELAAALALFINQNEADYNSIVRQCRKHVIEKYNPGFLARKFIENI